MNCWLSSFGDRGLVICRLLNYLQMPIQSIRFCRDALSCCHIESAICMIHSLGLWSFSESE